MIQNYFKVAIRKHKFYTALNILDLASSVTACFSSAGILLMSLKLLVRFRLLRRRCCKLGHCVVYRKLSVCPGRTIKSFGSIKV
jgi:hypothetical protein